MKKLTAYSLQVRGRRAQRGFTLLLAALVSSIVLAVGAAIFSIAQKQVILSALGRDSQFAFYAADTAAECALYWDFRFLYFGEMPPPNVEPKCDEKLMNFTLTDGTRTAGADYTMTSRKIDLFSDIVDVSGSGNLCAEVWVAKSLDSTGAVRTVIHADGYSTDCASIDTSARALQRSVELHY